MVDLIVLLFACSMTNALPASKTAVTANLGQRMDQRPEPSKGFNEDGNSSKKFSAMHEPEPSMGLGHGASDINQGPGRSKSFSGGVTPATNLLKSEPNSKKDHDHGTHITEQKPRLLEASSKGRNQPTNDNMKSNEVRRIEHHYNAKSEDQSPIVEEDSTGPRDGKGPSKNPEVEQLIDINKDPLQQNPNPYEKSSNTERDHENTIDPKKDEQSGDDVRIFSTPNFVLVQGLKTEVEIDNM
ncbi:unnamed protein product [Heligmosomoides polygyrus]|uniref:Organ specific protein n=1 Tax=Heligmosomoides polygyrus TaxID=6339 RepID=A0A183FUA9_HELPZ|nr:unnamed protein product [Heligmosomoides polygyrus]